MIDSRNMTMMPYNNYHGAYGYALIIIRLYVGARPRSYRKSCYIETRNSKELVPKRPRRESSTTTLKAVAKKRELNHCT